MHIKSILEKYEFIGGFSTDDFSSELHKKAKELEFQLPEQTPLLLIYYLGTSDCDSAYFYDVNGPVTFNCKPTLEQIDGLSKDLTTFLPLAELVSYYREKRFAIPALRLWQNGKIKAASRNAGTEEYRPDYWKDDHEELLRRANRDLPGLLQKGIDSIPKI
ncbi:MAG: hypothetical protein AABX28_01495 [Nanoarchaeota archaeon]